MRARGWAHEDVLFVDDSIAHIEKARRARRTRQLPPWPCALRAGPAPAGYPGFPDHLISMAMLTTVNLTMCHRRVCRTLHVTGKSGVEAAELAEIRRAGGA